MPLILQVLHLSRQSQMAISLSWPPLTHTSLFLKARSSTPSCPSITVTGLMVLELITDPNSRLAGAPPASRSNHSIRLPEAVIRRMREGANLIAQLGFSDLVVLRMISGVLAQAALELILYLSDVHRYTSLVSLLEARIFLLAGEVRITITSPGCVMIVLILILGCFLAASWLNKDLTSLMKQWSSVGSSTDPTMMQLGVFCHICALGLYTPSVLQEKYKRWVTYSGVECRMLPHCREVTGHSMKFSYMQSQKPCPKSRHRLLYSNFSRCESILISYRLQIFVINYHFADAMRCLELAPLIVGSNLFTDFCSFLFYLFSYLLNLWR